MVRHNGYQGSHVLNSSNTVVANVYTAAANTKEYFSLRDENNRLAQENAILRNMLKTNYRVLPLTEYERYDTLYKQQYTYVNAKIVNSTVNKRRNFLTLNIGADFGITRDMSVISSNGIIGKVTDVSANFCSVMSLLHKDSKINCQLKNDASYGPLIWDLKDPEYCLLTDIGTHAKVKRGDTVVTSELSGIFPEGLFVGTVDAYERRQNEDFYTIRVKLGADLKKVNHVYIIKNKLKKERDSLEGKVQKQIDD